MKKLIFILTISVFCLTGCLSKTGSYQANYDFGGIDKIAILSVNGQVQNDEAKEQISNLFVIELLNKGYAPIPLAQVQAKLNAITESNEASSIEQKDYVKIGRALNVPALLIVNIPYLNNEISITAQLINAKDGSVLWLNQNSGDNEQQDKETAVNRKGRNQEDYLMDPLLMIEEQPKAPKAQETPAATTGERALTPRELHKIEIIVSEICSTLPQAKSPKAEIEQKTSTKRNTSNDW